MSRKVMLFVVVLGSLVLLTPACGGGNVEVTQTPTVTSSHLKPGDIYTTTPTSTTGILEKLALSA